MCLTIVHSEKPASEGVGFKVFVKTKRGKLTAIYFDNKFKQRTWNKTKSNKTIAADCYRLNLPNKSGPETYPSGFHIFTDKESANRFRYWSDRIVRKVKYRGAHTQGNYWFDKGGHVVIATEFFILPEGA